MKRCKKKSLFIFYLFYLLLNAFNASAQSCRDTSFKITYEAINGNLINSLHLACKNGENYYVGKFSNSSDTSDFILKTSVTDDIIWCKKSEWGGDKFNVIQNIIESENNSIIFSYKSNTDDLLTLVKVTSNGTLSWIKSFSDINTLEIASVNLSQIDNNIYLSFYELSSLITDGQSSHNSIVKLDLNGNLIWKKFYGKVFSCKRTFPLGLIKSNDSLIVFGRIAKQDCVNPNGDSLNRDHSYYSMKISISDGAIGKSVSYTVPSELGLNGVLTTTFDNTNSFSINKINQDYIFTNKIASVGGGAIFGGCKVVFDSNLNIINAKRFANTINGGNTFLTTNQNGFTSLFFRSKPNQIPASFYIAQFDNYNNLIRQKKSQLLPSGLVIDFRNSRKPFANKQNYLNFTTSVKISNFYKILLTQMSQVEQTSSCFGEDTTFVTSSNYLFTPFLSPFFDSAVDLPLAATNLSASVVDLPITKSIICQTISTCSTLTVTPSVDTVCKLNNTYTYKANLNEACKKYVNWQIDTSAVNFINIIDDSTVQIQFKKTWQGYLYASVSSCSLLKDSVKIYVYKSPNSINLSISNTSFCTSNSILLNAQSGFKNYIWQNGSTDSTFLATMQGQYYVTAYDYCGNKFSDTIQIVKYITRPPISLGADTIFCADHNNTLHAGVGYKSYLWSTGATTSSINITTSGNYSIMVKDSCDRESRDTIAIRFYSIPTSVNLGADKEYCEGKSYTFDAGPNYKNYIWQNGSTNTIFVASVIGKYYVTVTDSCGNVSCDSVEIKKSNSPKLNLNYPFLLCVSDTAIFHLPSNFLNYTWQPNNLAVKKGSSLMLFPLVNTTFNISAETINGCLVNDTLLIKTINCPTDIYFPTAFTPNGDNLNDIWKPITQKKLYNYELKIYNRYGKVIFNSNFITSGWNGKFLGELQNQGTFIYSCKFKVANKVEQIVKGTILLLW